MTRFCVPSDAVSTVGRAAHDVGLAAILGGNLFARFGMHPAMTEVTNERERGRVVNRAWARYGAVNGVGLAAVITGWVAARANETRPRWLTARERQRAGMKDMAIGAVTVTGLASAIAGTRFARMEPDGAVPLIDGDRVSPNASDTERRTKRLLNALGVANLISATTLAGINASIAQASYRRPPLRRLARRNW
ncbi:MAG TPA: hypothetical protein VHF58_05225 [Solirubrobacterales bacterium]|nr:hypothetical protein [Solirubrobacterales bacterium]